MNKKSTLTTIAALGLVACSVANAQPKSANRSGVTCVLPKPADKNKLLSQLDSAHAQMYNSMDCDGQNLAMQLANQSCKGKNSCKGLNACATKQNSCAGQGGCKGKGKGPFTDKNKAIEVANKHMSEKRMNAMGQ